MARIVHCSKPPIRPRYLLGPYQMRDHWLRRVTLPALRLDFADDPVAGLRYGRVISFAMHEPRKRREATVTSADLLLAFAADTPGVVARVLQRYGLDLTTLRARIEEWQDEDVTPSMLWPASRMHEPLEAKDRRFVAQPRHWWNQ